MHYIINESQKGKIIDALRFAADTANARVAHDWNRLADYLEVLEAEKTPEEPSVKPSSEAANLPSTLSA